MLAIKIDGCSHDQKSESDLLSQDEIKKFGVNVVRFTDMEIKKEMDRVLQELRWHMLLREKEII